MNDEIILDFNALCRLAEQKKLSAEAEKYIYLLWLGLTEREAGSACYNPATKTVDLDDRTVFVKEEKIENCLSSDGGRPFSREELSAVRSELEKAESSSEKIYESGFFNIRFEQSLLKQPEDSVRIREMMRHIKRTAEELDFEYENYCKMRSKA